MYDTPARKMALAGPRGGNFSIVSRHQKLVHRLGVLERLISSEHRRPQFNPVQIHRLKRMRLRTKDALRNLSKILRRQAP